MNRRRFLTLGALTAAGAAAAPEALAMGRGPDRPELGIDRVVDSNCQFCQVRCRLKVSLSHGRIVLVEGNPENRWTAGSMCPKGKSQVELVASPYRLLYPLVREGDGWKRIGYGQALDMVAERIKDVKAKHPRTMRAGRALAPLWDCREGELAAL
jgi:anaerobic selenocysteine-containing dehydrogenase